MCGNSLSTYQKLKAAILLLCLCLVMVGACPVQKLLSNAFFVSIQTSKQPKIAVSSVKSMVICSHGRELSKAPLIGQSKKSSGNNSSFFLFIATLPYPLTRSSAEDLDSCFKEKNLIVTGVPLFLRNQVFKI